MTRKMGDNVKKRGLQTSTRRDVLHKITHSNFVDGMQYRVLSNKNEKKVKGLAHSNDINILQPYP